MESMLQFAHMPRLSLASFAHPLRPGGGAVPKQPGSAALARSAAMTGYSGGEPALRQAIAASRRPQRLSQPAVLFHVACRATAALIGEELRAARSGYSNDALRTTSLFFRTAAISVASKRASCARGFERGARMR